MSRLVMAPARTRGGRSVAFAALLLVVLAAPAALARPAPDSFADLAERLLPAVVNISTTQTIQGRGGMEVPQLPPGSPFEEFFKEFFDRNQPDQRRHKATSLGSGFIIDARGYVVTNNHVIQDADEITVVLHDETRLQAKVVGRDAKTDMAVLKVEAKRSLPFVPFGDSDRARVGDWVLAIGNPFGLGSTVTAGIISARGRDINAGPYDDFIQTDASINKGNSGGPTFNTAGEVIGINTAIFSPSGGSVGIGFAYASAAAKPVIEQLIKFGEVRRGWLGVRIQAVTEEIAEPLGLRKSGGALVSMVIAESPAEAAGIKAGDVILSFGGKPIDEMRRLPRIVAEMEAGKSAEVVVWRDGKELRLKVDVGALKDDEPQLASRTPPSSGPSATTDIGELGLTIATVDEHLRERFSLDESGKGVVVTSVAANSAAAEKGIRPGDVIVEVSQKEVSTPEDVRRLLAEATKAGRKSVLLLVDGQGGLRFVAMRIGKG